MSLYAVGNQYFHSSRHGVYVGVKVCGAEALRHAWVAGVLKKSRACFYQTRTKALASNLFQATRRIHATTASSSALRLVAWQVGRCFSKHSWTQKSLSYVQGLRPSTFTETFLQTYVEPLFHRPICLSKASFTCCFCTRIQLGTLQKHTGFPYVKSRLFKATSSSCTGGSSLLRSVFLGRTNKEEPSFVESPGDKCAFCHHPEEDSDDALASHNRPRKVRRERWKKKIQQLVVFRKLLRFKSVQSHLWKIFPGFSIIWLKCSLLRCRNSICAPKT